MAKIDFKKTLSSLYSASSTKVSTIDVPSMNYLMIDGTGNPNDSQSFQDSVEALYSAAYTLKFLFHKKEKPEGFFEYVVPPLEGLWWMKGYKPFDMERKQDWLWTMMIMLPAFYSPHMVQRAVQAAMEKKQLPMLNEIRVEPFKEGTCAQLLHIGPYSDEGPTLERLHGFIIENGYMQHGKHHEIYLSDPRRGSPEKWQTILRQPIRQP